MAQLPMPHGNQQIQEPNFGPLPRTCRAPKLTFKGMNSLVPPSTNSLPINIQDAEVSTKDSQNGLRGRGSKQELLQRGLTKASNSGKLFKDENETR